MKKLFGTDGIRGVAGQFPLTSKDAYLLGRAAGLVLQKHIKSVNPRIIIVRDTRRSGATLVDQLAKGFMDQGITVFDAGVLCTPSVAYLTRSHKFDSGVVVSASHNPPEFNGIKFFTPHGRKWPDSWEDAAEKAFFKLQLGRKVDPKKMEPRGARIQSEQLADDYADFLIKTLPKGTNFSGLNIALDCSNGANSVVAPFVFKALGAKLKLLGNKPNGRNINVKCGSQCTEGLARAVKKGSYDFGVAFDGDADRVIFVDEKGGLVDGDFIVALLSRHLKSKKKLRNGKAVITIMANLGLKKALKSIGVKTVETPVGDRYVSEAMKKHNSILGGEQSGHIILGQYLPSGDGLLTALHVAAIARASKKPFSEMVSWIKKFPQVLLNVRVPEKKPIAKLNGVAGKIKSVEKTLGDQGRVVVRYSGTEPLLRIMIEGPQKKTIEGYAADIARHVQASFK